MIFTEKIVSEKELNALKRKRSQKFIFQKFEIELLEKKLQENWEVDKKLKSSVRMKKAKPLDEQFEDEVWCLFASLGFNQMNKDRNLIIPYGSQGSGTTKQIDVLAIDNETIILVECKVSKIGKKGDFKKELESINGIRTGLWSELRKEFPDRKIKYILATKNYEVSNNDMKRMKDLNIHHFDEHSINYFYELVKHLGSSARYQLLGTLFEGQKISGIENKIPAIRGKMGGHTYYSFSIEPEKLLKIAYVLHRNEANNDLVPTYQRIIKKHRLKGIQKFVNEGGFFANSLIVSINTKGKGMQFDRSQLQVGNSISSIGVLHLPQFYRSAYIIDGQHRLYGYAESLYSATNSIPVVAFEDLEQEKQIEIFMEINENQKSVSKNLRNTLNADLLWSSHDWNKRRQALRLDIAQKLGERQSSALFNRIVIGENESSNLKCITIDTIETALKSTNFFSRYSKKNAIEYDGTFDKGDNDSTNAVLFPFLMDCFNYLKDQLPKEWEKQEHDSSILIINNTVYALIKIFDDIINHLLQHREINPKIDSQSTLISKTQPYLEPIVDFFNSISDEARNDIKKYYGSGGKTKVWRLLQKAIHEKRNTFQPAGLQDWIRDNTKQYNYESFEMIRELETLIKKDFAEKLESKYGENWTVRGLPPKVYKKANNAMGDKKYENTLNGLQSNISIWDCITIENLKDVAVFSTNWSELFESDYTRREDAKIKGGKAAKLQWLNKLSTLKRHSTSDQSYSFSEEEFNFLKSLYDWLGEEKTIKVT